MRIWILLAAVACLLALASSPAEAKYSTESLTIDGPGMDSPGVIESRRLIDRIYSATLVGTQRAKIAPPVQPGPAFFLEFEFGVADEDGARTETVDQIVYPFAQGGGQSFVRLRGKASTCHTDRFVSAPAGSWFHATYCVSSRALGCRER